MDVSEKAQSYTGDNCLPFFYLRVGNMCHWGKDFHKMKKKLRVGGMGKKMRIGSVCHKGKDFHKTKNW